jgi:hypothetical protein
MSKRAGDPDAKSEDTGHDVNLLAVTFHIDPSISKIVDEHMRLSGYLFDRFLTVDIFDAGSLFLYGTCKVPLFELLRQGRGSVVRAKECEMCNPESGDFNGAIQLIMSNVGHVPSVVIKPEENNRARLQPSQSKATGTKKIVKSKPMDLTALQGTNNPASSISAGVNFAANTLLS